jgi:ribosomal protein L37AE/L43A
MNNIDILLIHQNILKKFEQEKQKIKKYKKEKKTIQKSLESNLTHRMTGKLYQSLDNIANKIKDISNNNSYHFYIMESTETIEKYKDILQKPIVFSFFGKQDIKQHEKKELIEKYLKIANKYIDIKHEAKDLSTEQKNNYKCTNCSQTNFQKIDNNEICLDCGNVIQLSSTISSYKDSERINMSAKYTYDRKVHFKDCINQYQGKQNVNILPEVYTKLTEQFESHGLLLKSDDKQIKFDKITRKHIFLFLKELGYSKHYEDIILIHHNLTGKKPDNISHLEPVLLEDFDILVSQYDKKYKKTQSLSRKNFINTHYVLYQLLRRHKYSCRKSDFNILKSNERKSFHDKICKELFKDLGWNFTTTF